MFNISSFKSPEHRLARRRKLILLTSQRVTVIGTVSTYNLIDQHFFFFFFFWKWPKWHGGRYVVDANHNHMSCKNSVILHLAWHSDKTPPQSDNRKRKKVKAETEFKTINEQLVCCVLLNFFTPPSVSIVKKFYWVLYIYISNAYYIYFYFILAVTIFVLLLVQLLLLLWATIYIIK